MNRWLLILHLIFLVAMNIFIVLHVTVRQIRLLARASYFHFSLFIFQNRAYLAIHFYVYFWLTKARLYFQNPNACFFVRLCKLNFSKFTKILTCDTNIFFHTFPIPNTTYLYFSQYNNLTIAYFFIISFSQS